MSDEARTPASPDGEEEVPEVRSEQADEGEGRAEVVRGALDQAAANSLHEVTELEAAEGVGREAAF